MASRQKNQAHTRQAEALLKTLKTGLVGRRNGGKTKPLTSKKVLQDLSMIGLNPEGQAMNSGY